jgi:chlorite dismutase/nitrite reductase/ring-hydroxylating ferredoxin subunit
MTGPARQYVRFLFLRLDPAWRRLDAAEQVAQKRELGDAILRHHVRLLLRTFSLAGTRGDADLLFWQVADDLEAFQSLQTGIFRTRLGGYLSIAHSLLGVTRRSIYEFPDDPGHAERTTVRPQDSRYLFVYPFVKTREWYALPLGQRQAMMDEHVRVGRAHPDIRLNTIYSFGLDDQEFVVAFESDDPGDFVSLVMELRESKASAYTLRDTPTFTCIQMSVWDALDSLGGAPDTPGQAAAPSDAFVPVARVDDLPPGMVRRVYRGGDAIALFNVDGTIHAVSDRCTHGRASLSEGRVDPATCRLTCPWHGGVFDLRTGEPLDPPVRVALRTYEVRLDGDRILVR